MQQDGNQALLWRSAVIAAILRYTARHKTQVIEREKLIEEELDEIIDVTDSVGKTPWQTLSKELQKLRGEYLAFIDRGRYHLLTSPLDVTALPSEVKRRTLADALKANKLRFPTIATEDKVALGKRRKGQGVLRQLTLLNYNNRCALCDISDSRFLVASHIKSWGKHEDTRGDLRNVLCLCRFHDALFDKGYISLSDDYRLLIRLPAFSPMMTTVLTATTPFASPAEFKPLPEYLLHHRQLWNFEQG